MMCFSFLILYTIRPFQSSEIFTFQASRAFLLQGTEKWGIIACSLKLPREMSNISSVIRRTSFVGISGIWIIADEMPYAFKGGDNAKKEGF